MVAILSQQNQVVIYPLAGRFLSFDAASEERAFGRFLKFLDHRLANTWGFLVESKEKVLQYASCGVVLLGGLHGFVWVGLRHTFWGVSREIVLFLADEKKDCFSEFGLVWISRRCGGMDFVIGVGPVRCVGGVIA